MNLYDIKNLIAQTNYLATMIQKYQVFIDKNIEEDYQSIRKGKTQDKMNRNNPEEASCDEEYQKNYYSNENNQQHYQQSNNKNQDIYYSSQSHYQYSHTQLSQEKVLSDNHNYFQNQSFQNMNFPQIQLCDYPTTYPKSQKDKENQKKIQNIEKSVDKCLQAIQIGWHMNQRFIQHEERKKQNNVNKMNQKNNFSVNNNGKKINLIKKQLK